MAYLILTYDKAAHEHVRDQHRAAHYAHLEAHMHLLLASGGLRDDADERFIGGAILLDVPSRAEAEHFAAADPFTRANLFDRVEIVRWRPAFLGGARFAPPAAADDDISVGPNGGRDRRE